MTADAAREAWRNRIIGYDEVDPRSLEGNPLNARRHPQAQSAPLAGVLHEVGFVQDVIVNRTSGFILDGHLRVALAVEEGQLTIPVKYVELSPQEEALVLATLDQVTTLAEWDTEALDNLLRQVSTSDDAIQKMLADLADSVNIPANDQWDAAMGGLPDGERAPFQQMTFTVSDEQADIIRDALGRARQSGEFIDTGNENSNGNALARIAEAYLG